MWNLFISSELYLDHFASKIRINVKYKGELYGSEEPSQMSGKLMGF